MIESSLMELSIALAMKKISSIELATLFMDRIETYNGTLNTFITVDREKTIAMARVADKLRTKGQVGQLTGIPIAHKDNFCTKVWRSTCASRMLENYISPYDATVVEKLKSAGTIILGKLNMDEFAMGSSSETSYFGPVRNPWDISRVPGGSSGGSAAAIAARLTPAATGTDTGGSIRQPAAMCGVTGVKPTYGVVSRYGMIAYASSLDQGGPLAKSAEDCACLLTAIAGHDARDSTSLERKAENFSRELSISLGGIRVGVPQEYFREGLDDDVREVIEAALSKFGKCGARIVPVSLPNSNLAVPAYYVIASAEASSNLARFDGVRYGHRATEYTDFIEMCSKSRSEGFGTEVKRRILTGTYVLSHGYYDAYYLQAQKIRRIITNDFHEAWKSCDVIVGPTTPSVAFSIGEKTFDPVQMYLADIYTVAVNLAGLPSVSIPCGFGFGGMPVGLQIIGPWFSEARILGIAHQYQLITDWHTRIPAI